jgi:hypothetical protein
MNINEAVCEMADGMVTKPMIPGALSTNYCSVDDSGFLNSCLSIGGVYWADPGEYSFHYEWELASLTF